ncbi:MAG: hypothetical protein OEX07_07680, partial [Gammaproteobacteria bacterium]|nr:hypothetical protein [Gammaproteobacteria bacterium]
ASIRKNWDEIKPRLVELKDRQNASWQVEDVYASVLYEKSFLYVADEGFVIVKPQADFYTGEMELLIWIAVGIGTGLHDKYLNELKQMAKSFGATSLLMQSPRKGFERNPEWVLEYSVFRSSCL